MRLYLSSYKFGNFAGKLAELASDNKKVCIIMNALDFGDPERIAMSVGNQVDTFKTLGYEAEQLDLRDFFNKKDELRNHISKFGMVWVNGGNVFILKRAYEQSGFDTLIKEMLVKDDIVYAGYSAGVCVMCPTLHGSELVDNPNIVPEGYAPEFSWEGLGIFSKAISVHYKSDHPESADIDKEIEYFKEHNIPFEVLRDGEVYFENGEVKEFLRI
ncbi:MAG: peptidase E [bacterium]|nr:peptidase E [bacterium]